VALTGYIIEPGPARGALAAVQAQRDELDGLRDNVQGAMEDLIQAAGMRAVTTALSSVWNDLIALHAEAAETRIDNGLSGMERAIQAYESGSQTMMDDANATAAAAPVLAIDDAMVIGEEG
jgi:t-SNARE complex subunit (syntaxin)